jgi:preprotein translocase subunit YajC
MHGTVASVNKEARTFELDAEGIILVFELSAIRQVSKEGNQVSAATTVDPETKTETKSIEEDTTSENK